MNANIYICRNCYVAEEISLLMHVLLIDVRLSRLEPPAGGKIGRSEAMMRAVGPEGHEG